MSGKRERERSGLDLVARQTNWQGRDLQRKGKLNEQVGGWSDWVPKWFKPESRRAGEPESRGGGAVEEAEAESVKPFLSLRPFAAFAPLR